MHYIFSRRFRKMYRKLQIKQQRQCDERLRLFAVNHQSPQLNRHPLRGSYKGCWGISIGGDLRAIYQLINSTTAEFMEIGTHHELYGS